MTSNPELIKKTLRLSKFKNLVSYSSLALVMASPSLLFLQTTPPDLTLRTILMSMQITFLCGGLFFNFLRNRGARGVLLNAFNGQYFRAALELPVAVQFKRNNIDTILEIRKARDSIDSSLENKQRFYSLCARVMEEQDSFSMVYSLWRSKLNTLPNNFLLDEAGSDFFRLNSLVSMCSDFQREPWWDRQAFAQASEQVRNEISQTVILQSKGLDFLSYARAKRNLESFKFDRNSGRSTEQYSVFSSKRNEAIAEIHAIIRSATYKFTPQDYSELKRTLHKYPQECISLLQEIKGSIKPGQVNWSELLQVLQDNYKDYDRSYKSLVEYCITRRSEDEQALAQSGIIEKISSGGVEEKKSVQEKEKVENTKVIKPEVRCQYIAYKANYNQDLWGKIKDEYNLLFEAQDLLALGEFKKLNIGLDMSLAMIISSDINIKRVDPNNTQMQEMLRKNLELVLAEVSALKNTAHKQVNKDLAVGHKYLSMRG